MVLGFQAPPAGAVNFEFSSAFGADGTSAGTFSEAGSVAVDHGEGVVYVLDPGADALFKFDQSGNPINFGGSAPNISGNELSGLSAEGGLGARQIAVDDVRHIIYVTGGEESQRATALLAFQANGDPAVFAAGPGAGTNEISGFFGLRGIAVDSTGDIYAAGALKGEDTFFGVDVNVYKPSGALLLESAGGLIPAAGNIAVDGNGVFYVLGPGSLVGRYTPSEYPVTADTTYTVAPEPVDPHQALSVAVDPATNRVFVLEFFLENGEERVTRVAMFNEGGAAEGAFASSGDSGELKRPSGIAVGGVPQLGIEGLVARVFVTDNPEGGLRQAKIFQEQLVISKPTVEATSVSSVANDSATLRARINPNNRQSSYWFEYGTGDCDVIQCLKAPIDPQSIGGGRQGVAVAQALVGLESQTVYHYRVVAKNDLLETTNGPSKTFTTQGLGVGATLSDDRVWEMVSPPKKFGGTLLNANFAAIQADDSGNKLAYASRGPIVENPVSNRVVDLATDLAKRGGGGSWETNDLTPVHTAASRPDLATPYKIFSPDLLRAELEPTDDTPLSPAASEQTPYLWSDGSPPSFTPLVNPTNVFPPGTEFGPKGNGLSDPIRLEGASTDLEHVVIRSDAVPLVDGAALKAIYMWSGGDLEAVSELPESEGGGAIVEGMLGSGQGSVRHAVSDDGSHAFWSPDPEGYGVNGIKIPGLYLRDTQTGKSVRLDIVQLGGSGGEPNPAFNAASADGHVAYFTDSQQLTEDASPGGRDLYRCEVGPVEGGLGCLVLTDISAPLEGSGESAEVLDQISGVSEDGSRLFFVARGVLDEDPNGEGEVAIPGAPNLYYWREGTGVQFVAGLSEGDRLVWGAVPGSPGYAEQISADASPDGRFFAFTSDRSLTGYENRNENGQNTTEVFVYDTEANGQEIVCVSCNPSGAAAIGERLSSEEPLPQDPGGLWHNRWVAATLPEATRTELVGRSLYRPRAVLDSGRVFFNAIDPLVGGDSNGAWDVYQWQPVGVGTCASDSSTATVSRSGTGCVGLISAGNAKGDTGFLDASSSGNDVFFLTQGRLSVLDQDNELDVYDARVNGVPAVLSPVEECAGEACQGTNQAPGEASSASESIHKVRTPVRCRKGQKKIHRHGRVVCVHKKKHGKHLKKRAGGNGRAGR
jgi:hypothetical protein